MIEVIDISREQREERKRCFDFVSICDNRSRSRCAVYCKRLGCTDGDWTGGRTGQNTDPDAALTEGTSSWRGLELTQSLTAEHGGTVNFWIRNEGFDPVEITINRTGARVIEPGAEGHISAEVRWEKTDYLFEAKPAGETGSVEVDYKIAQRA